jgi:hypothetical protein
VTETEDSPRVAGCLPIELYSRQAGIGIKWMEFSADTLNEPFFFQTIARLRRSLPPAREFETGVETLLAAGGRLQSVVPAGLIFHLSRCGSTLIANVLRTADHLRILGEAVPINYLLGPYASNIWPVSLDQWLGSRGEILRCVVNMYGSDGGRSSQPLVIKFSSLGILNLPFIRSIWPDVPCIIVVRDPVEIVVSNLDAPTAWMRMKSVPLLASETFGFFGLDVMAMPPEEYAARCVGKLCQKAVLEATGVPSGKITIIDYAAINDASLRRIAGLFDLELPMSSSPALRRALNTQSKDEHARTPFWDDRSRKQFAATDRIRAEVERWARQPFEELARFAAQQA